MLEKPRCPGHSQVTVRSDLHLISVLGSFFVTSLYIGFSHEACISGRQRIEWHNPDYVVCETLRQITEVEAHYRHKILREREGEKQKKQQEEEEQKKKKKRRDDCDSLVI